VTGSVSSIFRTSFGIVLNNTLFSSIDGIRFRGKFMLLESQCVRGFFPSMDAIRRSSNPRQIPSSLYVLVSCCDVMEFKSPKEMIFKSDERKINILFNLIGPAGIKVYKNFTKKKNETFEEVVSNFKKYCEPRKNIIFQRFKFASCVQLEGQGFDDFVTELKKLASTCSFKEEDNMVRDRIVFGIRNTELKDRLINVDNLTLDKAEEMCRTSEATKKELREMENSYEVNGYKGNSIKKQYDNVKYNNDKEYLCKKCNKKHTRKNCPAYGKICRNCKKYNHFETGCKFKSSKSVMGTIKTESDSEDSDVVFNINKIKNVNLVKNSWMKNIMIQNLTIEFKLDTGSDINIITSEIYNKLNPKPEICKINYNVEAYGGARIMCLGQTKIDCFIDGKGSCVIDFVVLKKESKTDKCIPILGVGLFPDEYKIQLKHNANPKIVPYHRIPLTVIDRLIDKLKNMIELGIISYMNEPIEWLNNIVIIKKPNKTLRICLDPQNLNLNIKDECFPIPTLSEIAPKLLKKKIFSVLDLKDGFWQIKLDCESNSSKSGIGCCIFQDDKPIAYASQSLNDHECQWAQVEKEIYGIPLISVMTKELNKIKNNRLRRMKTRLAIYNLDVKYIPGRKMVVADCLSRDYIVTKSSDDRTMDDVVHSIEMKQIEFSEDKLKQFQ
ncbi:hypothetical protein AGLY_007828, partial [Aphis glycines]